MNEKSGNESKDVSVLSILVQIKDESLDPKTLTREVRQSCVEALIYEGHQIPSIAQLLKVSDRTIKRDLEIIYERNSMNPNPELAKKLMGEFVMKMRSHHAFMVRAARGRGISAVEKAQIEFLAAKQLCAMMETLRSLGFLPSASSKIVGEFYHYADSSLPENSLEEIKKTVLEIQETAAHSGTIDPEVLKAAEELNLQITKAELEEAARKLAEKQKQSIAKEETGHE